MDKTGIHAGQCSHRDLSRLYFWGIPQKVWISPKKLAKITYYLLFTIYTFLFIVVCRLQCADVRERRHEVWRVFSVRNSSSNWLNDITLQSIMTHFKPCTLYSTSAGPEKKLEVALVPPISSLPIPSSPFPSSLCPLSLLFPFSLPCPPSLLSLPLPLPQSDSLKLDRGSGGAL